MGRTLGTWWTSVELALHVDLALIWRLAGTFRRTNPPIPGGLYREGLEIQDGDQRLAMAVSLRFDSGLIQRYIDK